MGTAFAGIVRAPMTSVVMIFETTRDYAVIVPLMISNLLSFFISSRLQRKPIYEELARQDGIHLPTAESRSAAGQARVAQAMRPALEILDARMTVREATDKLCASEFRAWPVKDEAGVIGMVSRAMLQKVAADGGAARVLRELTDRREFAHAHSDQPLSVALERMGAARLDVLPVVSRADVHKLEGIIASRDILSFYGLASPDSA